jgi:hypothetical protein
MTGDPFDLRTLRADVDALCRDGTRAVGSRGHGNARAYLAARLTALGVPPYADDRFEATYDRDRFTNLIGLLPGRNGGARPPLLIGAHYDTCGHQPGADDNAIACALVLAIARHALAVKVLQSDLIVALYDAEEPLEEEFQGPDRQVVLGVNMGSRRFFEEQARQRPRFSLVFDLVGHAFPLAGHEDRVFLLGAESHPEVRDAVSSLVREPRLGLTPVTALEAYLGHSLSDYDAAKRHGYPYLFMSCGRWEHYHRPTDTPDRLDYAKAALIGALAFDLLAALDGATLAPSAPADTDALDLLTMRRGFGAALAAHGIGLDGRRDLDRAASALMALERGRAE